MRGLRGWGLVSACQGDRGRGFGVEGVEGLGVEGSGVKSWCGKDPAAALVTCLCRKFCNGNQ